MKKILFLIIALFLVNLCISAQIQRKFFDFTLGKTSKSEIESFVKSKGMKTYSQTTDRIVVDGMRFGGIDWSTTAFIFYNGKLHMVYFADDEYSSSKDVLASEWNRIVNSIDKKYSDFLKANQSNEKRLYYDDNTTSISLTFTNSFGKDAITLMYADVQLTQQQIKDGEDEL